MKKVKKRNMMNEIDNKEVWKEGRKNERKSERIWNIWSTFLVKRKTLMKGRDRKKDKTKERNKKKKVSNSEINAKPRQIKKKFR